MADRRPTQATVNGRFIGGGLFQPRAPKEDPEKLRYSACIILDKGEDAKVQKIIAQAMNDKFNGKKPGGFKDWGVRVGDDEEFETSFGKNFINPKSIKAPKTLVRNGTVYEATTLEDGVIYPGCHVAVSIEAYAYEKNGSTPPGASLQLRGVMFRGDGDRLDDYMDAEAEFSGVEVEEAANDDDDFLNPAA